MLCLICEQRDRDYGQCCPLCPSRLARRLAEIPDLCAELYGLGFVQRDHRGDHGFPAINVHGRRLDHFDHVSNVLPSGPINGAGSGPRVGGSTERPVPIRIDPTDLLAAPRPASLAVHVRSPWPADQIGYLPIATELDFWATDWAEQRGEARPPIPSVPGLVRWLGDRLDWAVDHHPALDEFAEKIYAIRGALMGALGLYSAPPKSMEAPCRNPDCEGKGALTLWQEYPGARVQCGACTALLSEEEYADYVRGLIEEAKESAA